MLFKAQKSCNPFQDNLKMNLQDVGWEDMDWIHLGQHRDGWWTLINAVMKLRVPKNAEKLLNSEEGFCSMELIS
jgi:hypothetical protein